MLLLLTTFWGIPSPPKSFPLLWYIFDNDKLEYTSRLLKQPKMAVNQVGVVRLCILCLINQYVVKRKMIRFLNWLVRPVLNIDAKVVMKILSNIWVTSCSRHVSNCWSNALCMLLRLWAHSGYSSIVRPHSAGLRDLGISHLFLVSAFFQPGGVNKYWEHCWVNWCQYYPTPETKHLPHWMISAWVEE